MSVVRTECEQQPCRNFVLTGLVQGRGVRPAVSRLAVRFGLRGFVRNSAEGVDVTVTGDVDGLTAFAEKLGQTYRIANAWTSDAGEQFDGFVIRESRVEGSFATVVPTDVAICSKCIADLSDGNSRRFGYPFTTCTQCGPRYSILAAMPFDRQRTSMHEFAMCNACHSEYTDAADRRFHSQTNCCANCGPRCWVTDQYDNVLESGPGFLSFIADAIVSGQIVAVKGLGGYQLMCDATQRDVVAELRTRKHRARKPLAVLVRDLRMAVEIAEIDSGSQTQLSDPANPIVIMPAKNNGLLAEEISPGLNTVGVMLPATGLHWMIADRVARPLVLTSANLSGGAIVYRNDDAMSALREVADLWLHHDREILRPIDDSVVQFVAGQCMTVRAARGISPMSWSRSVPSSDTIVSLGGHQKCSIGIATTSHWLLGPHIGDLETEETRSRFMEETAAWQKLIGNRVGSYACDQHPDYFSSMLAEKSGQSVVRVQHHHAHVVSAAFQHGLLDQQVLGIAFDGSGAGSDQTIWGGEILIASPSECNRVGYLQPFRLPGGAAAIQQPWRTALSLISQVCDGNELDAWIHKFTDRLDLSTACFMIDNAPMTTSMGRLFDAVAAISLGIFQADYEGEPAMRLESACDESETGSYRFELHSGDSLLLDWRPLLVDLLEDLPSLSSGRIAMKFHRAVANAVVEVAGRFAGFPAVVCGGVFQNRLLLKLIHDRATALAVDIRFPGSIPTNDGGLALGQLIAASAMTPHSGEAHVAREDLSCA
ncbi:carbamoyltransferase HypF [Stieleria varia]|uniref:Carbamoyltransferase n=1 Tax=Stieleria varia TaxID=2528005 RepID=A0A5C5ZY90_9BACT|nr:carbamoyltransferase HypF [Stieleria varia]TWT91273.1 Carbamoyltransferase HypF [Stieleria varia]